MLLPASALLLFVVLLPFWQLRLVNMCTTLGAILVGFSLYHFLEAGRARGWFAFEQLHFDVEGVWGPRVPCSPAWPEANYGVVGALPMRGGD
jgi:hypothetical protein